MAEHTIYADFERSEDNVNDQSWVETDGVAAGASYGYYMRACYRFPLASMPAFASIDGIDFEVAVPVQVNDASGQYWLVGGYDGDGQAQPEAAAYGTYFPAAYDWGEDDAGMYTPAGVTDFRSVGGPYLIGLAADAEDHFAAAKAAANRFSLWIAAAEGYELGGAAWLARKDHATTGYRPKLIITYTPDGGDPDEISVPFDDAAGADYAPIAATGPTVSRIVPGGNLAVEVGTPVAVGAYATDPTDGDITADIEWHSSNTADGTDGLVRDAPTGNIDTTGWSTGPRTITPRVTNSLGVTRFGSPFVLTIGEVPAPAFSRAKFIIASMGGF